MIKADVDRQMSSITSRHKRTETKLQTYEQKCAKVEDDLQKKERELGDLEFQFTNEKRDFQSKIANLEHNLASADKDNRKLTKITKEYERDLQNLAKSEKELKKQFQKIEADYKNIDKKYTKSKKYARELEDKVIEKEGEIKQMKLQKKNDDLVSQIESTAGRGNELGELEFMQMDMPATTRAGGTRNLIS